jgi:hypothetical protein
MDSFRTDFVKQNPEWQYKLWTLESFERKHGRLQNHAIYNMETSLAAKSDILRYEVLYREGGVYLDADTLWIPGRSMDSLLDQAAQTGVFAATHARNPTTNYTMTDIKHGFLLLSSSFFGVRPRHPALSRVVEEVATQYENLRIFQQQEPIVSTGHYLFSYGLHSTKLPITILPTKVFPPTHEPTLKGPSDVAAAQKAADSARVALKLGGSGDDNFGSAKDYERLSGGSTCKVRVNEN